MVRYIVPGLVIGLACAGLWEPVAAQAPATIPPERLEAVERFVERNRTRLGLPGVAVSVATADSVLLARGYGVATVTGEPITGRTPFHIGSVTKTITAALAAELAAEGKLSLDDPVEAHLPDFRMRDPFEPGSITLRHLMGHRSGLSQWSGHDPVAQREGRFDHLAPARRPGEEAEYSSLNFIILGRVVEAATDTSYATVVRQVLFDPLGMEDAFVDGEGRRPSGLARGHQNWFGVQLRTSEPTHPRYLIPAGFIGASSRDLARYGGMLLGGGAFAGERILRASAVEALLGPMDGPGRALGWGRHRPGGTLALQHAGNARTSSARMLLRPEEGYAVAVLANTNSGPFFSATGALLDGVDGLLRGESVADPWPKERMFKAVLLIGAALSIAGLARRGVAWNQAGRPLALDPTPAVVGRLALDIGGAAVLIFGVPRFAGVPLSAMTEYFPDLGVALIVSAGAGAVSGILHAFTRSSTP